MIRNDAAEYLGGVFQRISEEANRLNYEGCLLNKIRGIHWQFESS